MTDWKKIRAEFPALESWTFLNTATFGQLSLLLQFNPAQDDANNGVVLAAVLDCAGMPINGATLKVQQNNADVGQQYSSPMAGGAFFVANVPDGATQVSARPAPTPRI